MPIDGIGLGNSYNTSLVGEKSRVVSWKRSKDFFTLSTREVGFIFRRNTFKAKMWSSKGRFWRNKSNRDMINYLIFGE